MLNWANQFNICCFLDNHHYNILPHTYECLLGTGALASVKADAGNAFHELRHFSDLHKDWLFGHLNYDLKNETEKLESWNPDRIQFPDLFFFIPEVVIRLEKNKVSIGTHQDDASAIINEIRSMSTNVSGNTNVRSFDIRQKFSRKDYLDVVHKLQGHIHRGDCYEINFCQEFFTENVVISPISVYHHLVNLSPNPFSGYYRLNDQYLMCASPERYLKKTGLQLLSQPIKGTSERSEDIAVDLMSRNKLLDSLKERTENVMIVDLVRNDLSRICKEGTVSVQELFGIYAFPQVYQMISTIKGEMDEKFHWVDAIRNSFPMGSMTGAPKKRVMELIEEYERSRRGIFSGALGYVSPDRDFDFNVIIRSIMYNASAKYISYQAGSAITYYSQPETEYEECLVKVEAIKKVLTRSVGQHSKYF